MDVAKTLNNYRVFPRIFSALFGILLWITVIWFMGLESPSPEQAAFATGMLGSAAAWFKFYVNSGNNEN